MHSEGRSTPGRGLGSLTRSEAHRGSQGLYKRASFRTSSRDSPVSLSNPVVHAWGTLGGSRMHKGRPYPFHQRYYATEAWFWPGYPPWKMHLTAGQFLPPPWNVLIPGEAMISTPGICSDNSKEITFTWSWIIGELTRQIVATMDCHQIEKTLYARWRMSIGDGEAWWSTALKLQSYPQRVVAVSEWDHCVPAPPYTSAAGPAITLRPATYAEGGSPWDDTPI